MWRNQILNLFCYLNCHKDIGVLIFSNFFDCAHLFTVQVCNFWTMLSPDYKKFISVEIVMVSEIKAIILIYFNTVLQQCYDLSWKLTIFQLRNVLKLAVYVIQRSNFLLLKADIHAIPSRNFFTVRRHEPLLLKMTSKLRGL